MGRAYQVTTRTLQICVVNIPKTSKHKRILVGVGPCCPLAAADSLSRTSYRKAGTRWGRGTCDIVLIAKSRGPERLLIMHTCHLTNHKLRCAYQLHQQLKLTRRVTWRANNARLLSLHLSSICSLERFTVDTWFYSNQRAPRKWAGLKLLHIRIVIDIRNARQYN